MRRNEVLTGNSTLYTAVVFDNTTCDAIGAPVTLANTSTGGYRQAGQNFYGSVINGSEITSDKNIFEFTAYGASATVRVTEAKEATDTEPAVPAEIIYNVDEGSTYHLNNFNVNITIKDSVVDAGYRVLTAGAGENVVGTLKANYDANGDGTPDTRYDEASITDIVGHYYYNINATLNLLIENTDVTSNGIFHQEEVYSASATPEYFSYVTNVVVGENVRLTNPDVEGYVMISEADRPEVKVNLTMADGTLADTGKINRYETEANTTLGAGASKIAHTTTNGDYGYIVTPNYDTYTYQLGTQDAVEFYWNVADGEEFNIDKEVTLAEATDAYRYEWTNVGNAYTTNLIKTLKFGVNLTLREDININIFLPKSVTPDALGLKVNDEAVTYEVYGDQNKVVIKGVDPTKADILYTITGAVEGAYGDSVAINGAVSIVDYIDKAMNKSSDDDDTLLQAVLNYVVAAGVYANEQVELPGTIAATVVEPGDYTDAKAPVTDEVITGVELVLDGGFKWKITTTANSAKATYTVNGVAQENVSVAVTAGTIILNLKAMDLTEDVTITAGESTVTFNYEWYAAGQDAGNANLQTLLAAIQAYAAASRAYKVQ